MAIFRRLRETGGRETREDEKKRTLPETTTRRDGETASAKISAETYEKTIGHMTETFGDVMPEEQRVRIDIEREEKKPVVLSSEEYSQRFPKKDPSVLGHYDTEGRIYMREGSPEVIRHVTTHEALHLTSYNELDDTDPHRAVYRSGIREAAYENGKLTEDSNRALNEGITERYAMQELQRRGEVTSCWAVNAYPEAQRKAYELEGLVGSRTVQEAYFGGRAEQLKQEVIRLNGGDETAWDRFSRNVDVLEYSSDPEKIKQARLELTVQRAEMIAFKESERHKDDHNL